MGKIVYEITSGTLPVTVDVSPLGLQNVHGAYGTYEFTGVDMGNYTVTFTDSSAPPCVEQEIITACLTCPEGYYNTGDGCEKLDMVAAEEHPPFETITWRGAREYSSRGTLIFEDDWTLGGTGTFEKINTTVEYWKNDWTSTIKGPMNRSGVWVGTYKSNQRVRFSFCVDIAVTKTYYIGVGCDNYASIYMDSQLILKQDLPAIAAMVGETRYIDRPPFNYWFVYPIEIPAGSHIIEVEGYNAASIAGVGIEIYDATKYDLLNATSDADLGSTTRVDEATKGKILFRAKDEVGNDAAWEYSPSGGYHGYICPPGYSLVTCDTHIYCQKRSYLECGQLFAEVETSTITYDPDCSILTYPNLANTGMSKAYIMSTYFEPDRDVSQFESIEIVRTIPDANADIKYNGAPVVEGQIIDFSEANSIEIYTKNYLESQVISDIYFKIHLIGESLPTQELHYRFINEACEFAAVPVSMFVSIDVIFGGEYDFVNELGIAYDPGNEVSFTHPTASGYHHMFISVPAGRSFVIRDPLNADITNNFSYWAEDARTGIAANTIYRYEEPFGTSAPVTFKIILE